MKSAVLMGPPGSGKTTMACLTAVRTPVHVIDVDRKLSSMANLQGAFASGKLTSWEVEDPLVEETLGQRVAIVAKNQKSLKPPKGWLSFASMVDRLPTDPISKGAGTWFIDSLTRLAAHLDRSIAYQSGTAGQVFSPRDWGSFLKMLQETITILIDLARAHDKDIIFSVHERSSEIPGPNTKVMQKRVGDMIQREYIGVLDLKVIASIAGQFGNELGSYFEEVYGLAVRLNDNNMPEWFCRVLPDGKRDLRTSFTVKQAEFPPDFLAIWR